MDALAALKLQVEWGADEALDDAPRDRRLGGPGQRAATPPNPVRPAPAPATLPAPSMVEAGSLEALREALARFDGCDLRRTATNLIFAEGDPAARLVLIADVPGPDEDRAGRPFAGPGGAFLDQMLASIGLRRDKAVLTSLIPWRPPGDRPVSEAELQACLPFFHRQLALLNPGFALLFGRLALRALTGSTARRPSGKWVELTIPGRHTPLPALPMPTIAAIRGAPNARRDAWADLIRLRIALGDTTS